jgi:hypothetical protein
MRLVYFLIVVIYVEAYIVAAAKYKEYRDSMPGMVAPELKQDNEPLIDFARK